MKGLQISENAVLNGPRIGRSESSPSTGWLRKRRFQLDGYENIFSKWTVVNAYRAAPGLLMSVFKKNQT